MSWIFYEFLKKGPKPPFFGPFFGPLFGLVAGSVFCAFPSTPSLAQIPTAEKELGPASGTTISVSCG